MTLTGIDIAFVVVWSLGAILMSIYLSGKAHDMLDDPKAIAVIYAFSIFWPIAFAVGMGLAIRDLRRERLKRKAGVELPQSNEKRRRK